MVLHLTFVFSNFDLKVNDFLFGPSLWTSCWRGWHLDDDWGLVLILVSRIVSIPSTYVCRFPIFLCSAFGKACLTNCDIIARLCGDDGKRDLTPSSISENLTFFAALGPSDSVMPTSWYFALIQFTFCVQGIMHWPEWSSTVLWLEWCKREDYL